MTEVAKQVVAETRSVIMHIDAVDVSFWASGVCAVCCWLNAQLWTTDQLSTF